MNSKFELRIESAKIAVNVDGVTSENVIEIAKAIEGYILGNAELPEFYDATTQLKELSEKFLTSNEKAIEETASKENVAE